ncbi:hypothetical protein V6N13_050647 [Hibiscus sabdariffa]
MASRKITLEQGLVMVTIALLWARSMAAKPDCIDVVITMAPCIDYVTGNSSAPSAACCSQLATVVRSDVRCLCVVINGGGPSLGVEINQTLALALPQLCNVKTPPPSNCKNIANGTTPSVSPAGSPPRLPASNSSTSGGFKTNAATPSDAMLKILLQFTLLLLPIALYSSTWTVAMAQSGCTSVLIGLSPCLNYITGTSSTPSQQCCTQLASVVRSSPQCLCQVLNGGGSSLGITINQTQALALPGSCNIQTPPISSCNTASPAPADSPEGSPESGDSPVGSPESGSIIPTGDGSKSVPSAQENGSSDGNTTKLSLSLFILLLATSYSSIFLSH